MATKQKAGNPVAAREQVAEREGDGGKDNLEQTAKDQEKLQKQELKDGANSATKEQKALNKLADKAPAGARVGHVGSVATVNGKMDNMSVRSDADALEGHFVDIDPNFDGVEDAYKSAGLIRDDDHERGALNHQKYYGVYIQPVGPLEPETGIPTLATVRLRDETNVLVTVPYDSLTRAEQGGRR